jgi:hypothetical protein
VSESRSLTLGAPETGPTATVADEDYGQFDAISNLFQIIKEMTFS